MGKVMRFVMVLGVCLFLFFVGFEIYFSQTLKIPNELQASLNFEIERGESIPSISSRLQEDDVIPSSLVFREYLKREKLDTQIEAGFFTFRGGETIPEVAQTLLRGEASQISLTILEGWNSSDIDAKLTELGLIQENDFALFVREGGSEKGNRPFDFAQGRPVASLEGYLFPATYKIDVNNFSVESLVARMLDAMEANLSEVGWDFENVSQRSLHEVLTMASIVELEEKSEANRAKVADILWRRLDEGMGLYADATLFYTLGHKKNLTSADFEINSPYNTRKYRGLPPTPICSPSLSAIKATLHPEANDYWYYLHDSEGKIHFAKTLEAHNENKREFIK